MKRVSRREFILSCSATLAWPLWARSALPAPPDEFRFGMLTDAHYAEGERRGSRFYLETLDKMRECISVMNTEKPSFVVQLGDFIDGVGAPSVEEALDRLGAVDSAFGEFGGPRYNALGNHCMDALSKSDVLGGMENTGIDPDAAYFSFDAKGMHCVVLDPNFKSDGTPYDKGNFSWTDANIPPEELEWLEDDLKNTRLPTIAFTHQLLDGSGNHYINNAPDVRDALENSGKVIAVFQGHQHRGQYNQINGIHYYTLKAMVEGSGEANNSYALVTIHPERIVVEGYRRADDREMDL